MLSSDGIESNIADLEEAKPELRMLNEGYPYITENGNFDTIFQSIPDLRNKEIELKIFQE
jgi:ribose 5-phosphate isomerase